MIATGIDILELIPQRPPVVMIDTLVYCDQSKTVSALTVKSDNIFFDKGSLTESGLIENIAQTAAAGVGYVCKTENRKVPVGFIASIKDLKIISLPVEGDILETEIVITNTVMGVSIIKGVIKNKNIAVAECEMRIFVKPD